MGRYGSKGEITNESARLDNAVYTAIVRCQRAEYPRVTSSIITGKLDPAFLVYTWGQIDHSLRRLKAAGKIRLNPERSWETVAIEHKLITIPVVGALDHPVEE